MTGEKIVNGSFEHDGEFADDKTTSWEDLKNEGFDPNAALAKREEAREKTEMAIERKELIENTVERIKKTPRMKQILKKIALGTMIGAAIVGGVANFNSQRGGEGLSAQEIKSSTEAFVDIKDDDLVWFEDITNSDGLTLELGEHNLSDAESYQYGDVTDIEMNWWVGQGDMYRASDSNGDGVWDEADRLNPYTNEVQKIEIDEDMSVSTMSEVQGLFN